MEEGIDFKTEFENTDIEQNKILKIYSIIKIINLVCSPILLLHIECMTIGRMIQFNMLMDIVVAIIEFKTYINAISGVILMILTYRASISDHWFIPMTYLVSYTSWNITFETIVFNKKIAWLLNLIPLIGMIQLMTKYDYENKNISEMLLITDLNDIIGNKKGKLWCIIWGMGKAYCYVLIHSINLLKR
tara:strand:+ start:127 stop:693 length:567 start_codon:yes stop_codon:yes gene_type:complete